MASEQVSPVSILLVEDENDNLSLLERILAMKYPELAIYCAVDVQAGWDIFTAREPEIVITDINLPGIGGVQLVDRIRSLRPGTKFIILTGDTGRPELEQSVGNGFEFDHFIVKPVGMKNLFAAIDQCLGLISGP